MSSKPHFILLISSVLTMQGCAQLKPLVEPPRLQASLRQPCPDLEPLEDGKRATVLAWIVGAKTAYVVCQSRHLRAVEASERAVLP